MKNQTLTEAQAKAFASLTDTTQTTINTTSYIANAVKKWAILIWHQSSTQNQ